MSLHQITLEYLEKEVWWWRPGATKHPCDFQKSPFDLKTPAPLEPIYYLGFNYELARRGDRSKKLISFRELGQAQLWIIGPSMGPPYLVQLASRDAGHESQETENGWTPIRPKFQWNLRESDRTLSKAFKSFIENQRTIQGIRSRKGHKRTRPISWRWLELMDLAEFKVDYLMKGNERSSLSNARKAAKRQLKLFEQTIDDYWESHRMADYLENGELNLGSRLEVAAWHFPAPVTPKPLYRHIWPQCE